MASYAVTIYTVVWNTCNVEAESPEDALVKGREVQSGWSLNESDCSEEDGWKVYEPVTGKSWNDDEEESEDE